MLQLDGDKWQWEKKTHYSKRKWGIYKKDGQLLKLERPAHKMIA